MARGLKKTSPVYSLLSGRHPSHRGRRYCFSLSSSSIFNKLALRVHLSSFPLLPSPARVTRVLDQQCQPPTFPPFLVQAAPRNLLTKYRPPFFGTHTAPGTTSIVFSWTAVFEKRRWPTTFPFFSCQSPPMRFPTTLHYLLNLVAKSIIFLTNGGRRTYGGHGAI